MGHRASVAYIHDGGQITVHHSHWGAFDAELLDQISKETPFGSENMEPEYVNDILAAFGESDAEMAGELTEIQEENPVKVDPFDIVNSVEEWAKDSVNALMHECAYLVDTRGDPWDVRAFAPVYWRGAGNMGERGYVLIEAGGESHDLWGGIDAESFSEFKNKASERGRISYIKEP